MEADREQLMDVRVVERNIKAGKISREDYDRYLQELEDCSDRAEPSKVHFVHHVLAGRSERLGRARR